MADPMGDVLIHKLSIMFSKLMQFVLDVLMYIPYIFSGWG